MLAQYSLLIEPSVDFLQFKPRFLSVHVLRVIFGGGAFAHEVVVIVSFKHFCHHRFHVTVSLRFTIFIIFHNWVIFNVFAKFKYFLLLLFFAILILLLETDTFLFLNIWFTLSFWISINYILKLTHCRICWILLFFCFFNHSILFFTRALCLCFHFLYLVD